MSKTALKIAGRHPMVLAFIMATAILGLLFSGWLAPVPSRAQTGGENPAANKEQTNNCVEHGPYWGDWSGACPSVITNSSVSPTSIDQCGVTAPNAPTNIVVPVYSSELWQQTGTYDCTNTVSTNTETIGYSVGAYQWDPPLPALVTNTFSSTVYVNVTSGDTNKCASPGRVDLGTVTWNLPCPTITGLTIDGCGALGDPVLENGVYQPILGAIIHYNFQCANGWYSWENNIITQNCDTTDTTTSQQTTATSDPWYNNGDGVGNTVVNPSALPCSMVSQQTIYFAPVGGGSMANNNSTCSFNFTRTLTIAPDSGNPGHGTITLEVTGLASPVTNQCNY